MLRVGVRTGNFAKPKESDQVVALYTIQCRHCGQSISLPETMLVQVVRDRMAADTGEPFLVLVCSRCKHAQRYNYEERSPAWEMTAEPTRSPTQHDPIVALFRARCVDSNCTGEVELIAVRDAGTTREQVLQERREWHIEGIYCPFGHPLLPLAPMN